MSFTKLVQTAITSFPARWLYATILGKNEEKATQQVSCLLKIKKCEGWLTFYLQVALRRLLGYLQIRHDELQSWKDERKNI